MERFLAMLEHRGLSLADAEAAGRDDLVRAARRCRRCLAGNYCAQWLGSYGRWGVAPPCPIGGYFDSLALRRAAQPSAHAGCYGTGMERTEYKGPERRAQPKSAYQGPERRRSLDWPFKPVTDAQREKGNPDKATPGRADGD
jgi:hypothetical protein